MMRSGGLAVPWARVMAGATISAASTLRRVVKGGFDMAHSIAAPARPDQCKMQNDCCVLLITT
jgi:hypothetical protein